MMLVYFMSFMKNLYIYPDRAAVSARGIKRDGPALFRLRVHKLLYYGESGKEKFICKWRI